LGKYHNRVYKKKNSTLSSFSQLLFFLAVAVRGDYLKFSLGEFGGAQLRSERA